MFKQYEYVNQTQLGKIFGESSHTAGRWLVAIGLRTPDLKPSRKAFQGGFVSTAENGKGTGWYYVWHREKTVAALEAAGHRQVYAEPAPAASSGGGLKGPFHLRACGTNAFEVLNGDGEVSVWVVGDKDAPLLVRLLNLAHKHGIVA